MILAIAVIVRKLMKIIYFLVRYRIEIFEISARIR